MKLNMLTLPNSMDFERKADSLDYPLKRQEKNASENVVCCKWLPNITDKLSIEAEWTQNIGAVWSGSTLFAIEAS